MLAVPFFRKELPLYEAGSIYRDEKLYSPASIEYIDLDLTRERHSRVFRRFPVVYVRDYSKADQSRTALAGFFRIVTAALSNPGLTEDGKITVIRTQYSRHFKKKISLGDAQRVRQFLSGQKDAVSHTQNLLRRVMDDAGYADMSDVRLEQDFSRTYETEGKSGVFIFTPEGELIHFMEDYQKVFSRSNFTENLEKSVKDWLIDDKYKPIMFFLVRSAAQFNLAYNKDLTLKNKQNFEKDFPPVKRVIKPGEKIIDSGERVTPRHVAIFTALRRQKARTNFAIIFGNALLVLGLMMIVYFYAKNYVTGYGLFSRYSLIFAFSLLFVTGLTFIVIRISALDEFLPIMFVPMAFVAMTVTILIQERMALFFNFVLAVFIFLITDRDAGSFLIAFFSGTIAVFAIARIKNRNDLFKAGFFVAAGNLASLLVVGLILGRDVIFILQSSVVFVINGLLCSILTIGMLPLFETTLGITTVFKLMELSDVNTPILKKMLVEASGTYNHSILVATLSENAAEAVTGGNPLLARVASYYHDAGKVERPEYFIENQNEQNIHDTLKTSISVSIIKNHVKRSVEIAEEMRLPAEVRDIIAQHHGMSLIRYFYNKEMQAAGAAGDKARAIPENSYRYPGPRPQSLEAGIVMLADCCEAAVRALDKPTFKKIQSLIAKIINDKIKEGELQETPLRYHDITAISKVFTNILAGVYHTRIDYPGTED